MALQNDTFSPRDEPIKSQFMTREGTYKLMTLSEYSRPKPPFPQGNASGNAPVRVSFLTLEEDIEGAKDCICFNSGRELYVYPYRGLKKACDLNKPIDKRVYKGTFPTCHDFELTTATAESSLLIIGFSAGQIQLIDPFKKDVPVSKLYNEERLVDKSRVTCLKWLPASSKHFLAAHSSGQMYLYSEDLPCSSSAPSYQLVKQADDYCIYSCKTKATRNPISRWVVGEGAINEFAFSPDTKFLAIVSQDGYLRIFNYESLDLVGLMRSYFGGLLCLAWSPDGKYIVTGGEDDLVSVYSFHEKRLVCRGHGHRSWVSVVAFDPFTTSLGDVDVDFPGSEDDVRNSGSSCQPSASGGSLSADLSTRLRTSFRLGRNKKSSASSQSLSGVIGLSFYRFGSVSHDTTLCLWDLTEDILRQPPGRLRTSAMFSNPQNYFVPGHLPPLTLPNNFFSPAGASSAITQPVELAIPVDAVNLRPGALQAMQTIDGGPGRPPTISAFPGNSSDPGAVVGPANSHRPPNKGHKKGVPSIGSRTRFGRFGAGHNANHAGDVVRSGEAGDADRNLRLFGTLICPRLDEVAFIEPLITKKIAHERLTVLIFREDCIITACQEGFICTWARPGKAGLSMNQDQERDRDRKEHNINSPNPGGSPNLLPGGTIV